MYCHDWTDLISADLSVLIPLATARMYINGYQKGQVNYRNEIYCS